jgi:hypothetical protein
MHHPCRDLPPGQCLYLPVSRGVFPGDKVENGAAGIEAIAGRTRLISIECAPAFVSTACVAGHVTDGNAIDGIACPAAVGVIQYNRCGIGCQGTSSQHARQGNTAEYLHFLYSNGQCRCEQAFSTLIVCFNKTGTVD